LPRERWERALNRTAFRCEAVLFLVSKNWLASEWCLKEHSIARGKNKALFAALVDATLTIDQLPESLTATWQVVDLARGVPTRTFPTRIRRRTTCAFLGTWSYAIAKRWSAPIN
jgi:hypothetical protein